MEKSNQGSDLKGSSPNKSVVIVGGGPCGLVALKEMLEAGHSAILFERTGRLGGVFANPYPSIRLTISNWFMGFSDFPDPQHLCYPSAEHYLAYLNSYAKHFDLHRHITFGADVREAVLRIVDGGKDKWRFEIHRSFDDSTFELEADALIVATGANSVPKRTPPGSAGFSGRIMHSAEYDKAFEKEVAAKKQSVLVIGSGESAANVSSDLAAVSPGTITSWIRRESWTAGRYLLPGKEMTNIEANKERQLPVTAYLECHAMSRLVASQNVYAHDLSRRPLCYTPYLQRTRARMCLNSAKRSWLSSNQSMVITKSQRHCEAIQDGSLNVVVGSDVRVADDGRTCIFSTAGRKAAEHEFDIIVLCTGYRAEFPWIKLSASYGTLNANPRSWWLHCFHPGLGNSLFFVGYARPLEGGIPVLAEILSRYIALLLRGDRSLPLNYAELAVQDEASERERFFITPDLHTLVDLAAFNESVARRIGCEPKLPISCVLDFQLHMLAVTTLVLQLLPPWLGMIAHFQGRFVVALVILVWTLTFALFFVLHEGLLIKWWLFPHWSVWYRQRGPGTCTRLQEQVLTRVSFWRDVKLGPAFALAIGMGIISFYVQRYINLPLFVVCRILSVMDIRFARRLAGLVRPKMFALHSSEWRLEDVFLP